ncbi:kinase suppressor of Ras 2-like isoform X2 [Pomacea canaliculata]|nr:kinase suppressor of Ras 2-like isoform X2 [Pomacea canaliculata]
MCSVRVVAPRPRDGLLATIASRIRHWLQSRRKYEISPRDPFLNTSSSSAVSTPSKEQKGVKDAVIKDTVMPDCDAVLNRCGAGRLSPRLPQRLPNGFAAATAAETGKIPLQRSPVAPRHSKKQKSPSTPSKMVSAVAAAAAITFTSSKPSPVAPLKAKSKSPVVDIKIEVVDVSGHSPSALSPSAHRLLASSRRHLLRQSRSKLKDRAVLITSLMPDASALCHQPLTTTISCPPQAEVVAGAAGFGDPLLQSALRRCHSWPLPRRKAIPDDDECPDSAKEEALQSAGLNGQESLEDCSIRFDDLEIGECIKTGRRCKIYKARWHGDVYVHLFGELVKRPDREGFWRDVAKLCRIRHENINLFMGACTMAPNLAVITSFIAGKSLFEHIHVQKEKMTLHTRVQVLQGVAQGMGYLHAKGIVLRKLNTSNIFLTPRVKVSAIDFSLSEARHNRKDYATIPRGHLTYVAPELLKTLRIVPPRLVPKSAPSPESDVFAFGTIMYEVLGGSYPYPGFPPESIIWSVCSGHRQNLSHVNCTLPLKTLIEECWSQEPLYRPDFPELSKELHKNSPQYKRHSSSEPERLNRSPGVLE